MSEATSFGAQYQQDSCITHLMGILWKIYLEALYKVNNLTYSLCFYSYLIMSLGGGEHWSQAFIKLTSICRVNCNYK